MIESPEQIQQALLISGEVLTFSFGEILGIPGHLVYNIQSFDSPYDIYKQDYSFQIAYTDFIDNGIDVNDTFNYTLYTTTFNFEILYYVQDIIGWVELRVSLVEVTE